MKQLMDHLGDELDHLQQQQQQQQQQQHSRTCNSIKNWY